MNMKCCSTCAHFRPTFFHGIMCALDGEYTAPDASCDSYEEAEE